MNGKDRSKVFKISSIKSVRNWFQVKCIDYKYKNFIKSKKKRERLSKTLNTILCSTLNSEFSHNYSQGRKKKKICFAYRKSSQSIGSSYMRGKCNAELLIEYYGDLLEVLYLDEIEIFKHSDSVMFLTKSFIKDVTNHELEKLKKNKNILCADFLDKKSIDNTVVGFMDVLVACSIEQLAYYIKKHPDKYAHYVTHIVDSRVDFSFNKYVEKCKIGYFGELANAKYADELSNHISFVGINTNNAFDSHWINELRNYNVHYAIRNHRRKAGYTHWFKPFTKGFLAAHCEANIIVSTSEFDAPYYLSNDYPYLLSSDSYQSVLNMVEYIHDSYGSSEWYRGLQIMEFVKHRSSRKLIAGELYGLFSYK